LPIRHSDERRPRPSHRNEGPRVEVPNAKTYPGPTPAPPCLDLPKEDVAPAFDDEEFNQEGVVTGRKFYPPEELQEEK
jgi:hypothetical protein